MNTPEMTEQKVQESLNHHDMEVLKHVNEVRKNIWKLIMELDHRGRIHDSTKFESPEREIYAATLPKLAVTVYDSPEYKKLLEESKIAIEHHWANNRHHPEWHSNGIADMDLIDLLEMIADWVAATKRNKNGNIHRSIVLNTPKYQITSQLASILTNTVNRYL